MVVRKEQGSNRNRTLKKKTKNPQVLKKLALAVVIALVAAALYTAVSGHTKASKTQRKYENTYQQLIQNKEALEKQKTDSSTQLQQKDQQLQEINKQLEETKRQLEAKKASSRVYADTAPSRPSVPTVTPTGSCADWLAAAGVTDTSNAMYIITRESGCNPNAVNKSSGACGVAQALPCSKMNCAMGDGACQVRWMNSYVLGRYGSWANAVAFWQSHHWY